MKALRSNLFLRYGLVGILGGCIQTAALYMWVETLQGEERYLIGAVLGFCIALLVTFTLQKYWTFRESSAERFVVQFMSYTGIALASLGLNVLVLHTSKNILETLGFDFFEVWYLIAQIVSVGVIAGFSFAANYLFTFRIPT
jgi:putative flippase GtrA